MEILSYLRCPICHEELNLVDAFFEKGEIISGYLGCEKNHKWLIREGIAIFNEKEQDGSNEWSILMKGKTPEEFDAWLEERNPRNLKALRNKVIAIVKDQINEINPKFILDIATGRGSFALNILDYLPENTHLICTDLSPTVLFSVQYKLKKRITKVKVSFVSCNAIKLPFKTNKIECITSYFGVTNMGGLVSNALKEIKRVLEPISYFFNCSLVVKQDSSSYKAMQKIYESRDEPFPMDFLDNELFTNYHLEHGFTGEYIPAGESIGEKNELDLIPVEGDWFEVGIFKGK